MNHPMVASVLATGGPGMVKAAYSTGKPALGVGPGNGPAYIEKTANIKRAVNDIVLSKTFDNGMVCASENSAVIDADIYDDVKKEMQDRSSASAPRSRVRTPCMASRWAKPTWRLLAKHWVGITPHLKYLKT